MEIAGWIENPDYVLCDSFTYTGGVSDAASLATRFYTLSHGNRTSANVKEYINITLISTSSI